MPEKYLFNSFVMQFHLEFTPKPLPEKISLQDRLLLIGSCFTEQIGQKLAHSKFHVLDNPHGILFNPISIVRALETYLQQHLYQSDELFYHNECWASWDHHTRFSDIQQQRTLQKINDSQHKAHAFLQQTNVLLITLGSSYVYELTDGRPVANCHKVPTDKFVKRLIPAEETIDIMNRLIIRLKSAFPSLKIIFTISPVRHLRDGFVENNRSKAQLITAVHRLTEIHDQCRYFPAYELVVDDLRDHRFYAEDLVHPNYAATNYVWEKFKSSCIADDTLLLMKELQVLSSAKNHKAFNPDSDAHQKFLQTNLQKTLDLASAYPYLDLSEETDYFKTGLNLKKNFH